MADLSAVAYGAGAGYRARAAQWQVIELLDLQAWRQEADQCVKRALAFRTEQGLRVRVWCHNSTETLDGPILETIDRLGQLVAFE